MNKILMALSMLFLSFNANADKLVLSSDNTLVLNRAFTRASVSKLMEQATEMDSNLKSGYPINLFLYTPGGSIQSGLELIELLNGLNRPINTITLFSASMGFQTVQHLGKRYILKYGVLMSHKARGAFRGEFGGGISQLDSRYQLWVRRVMLMDQKTVDRTNGKQTLKSYNAAYTPELWLNGEEAVEQGYADEVVTLKCDVSLTGLKDPQIEDYGFFKINVIWSKCPLKTTPTVVRASILTNKGEMTLKDFLEKNGQFGGCVKKYSSRKNYDSWDDETETPVNNNLCASDKTLTLNKIRKKIKERTGFFNRSLRDSVEYSY